MATVFEVFEQICTCMYVTQKYEKRILPGDYVAIVVNSIHCIRVKFCHFRHGVVRTTILMIPILYFFHQLFVFRPLVQPHLPTVKLKNRVNCYYFVTHAL
jgi:hypothetical protein